MNAMAGVNVCLLRRINLQGRLSSKNHSTI
nr:MAG TPA: hypothetical protein [Caudoviricetes sp.]